MTLTNSASSHQTEYTKAVWFLTTASLPPSNIAPNHRVEAKGLSSRSCRKVSRLHHESPSSTAESPPRPNPDSGRTRIKCACHSPPYRPMRPPAHLLTYDCAGIMVFAELLLWVTTGRVEVAEGYVAQTISVSIVFQNLLGHPLCLTIWVLGALRMIL